MFVYDANGKVWETMSTILKIDKKLPLLLPIIYLTFIFYSEIRNSIVEFYLYELVEEQIYSLYNRSLLDSLPCW